MFADIAIVLAAIVLTLNLTIERFPGAIAALIICVLFAVGGISLVIEWERTGKHIFLGIAIIYGAVAVICYIISDRIHVDAIRGARRVRVIHAPAE